LALERVDDVHGRDRLAARVFRVRDGITDAIFQKNLEDPAGFFVNKTGDTFDAATTGQATNGRLGDALNVVAEDFAMALGSSLAESFASLTTARHDDLLFSSLFGGNDDRRALALLAASVCGNEDEDVDFTQRLLVCTIAGFEK
jgi:hypothetical protein